AHTGDLASYGLPTVKAAELVVADWNARGGVLGRQIELVVADDVCRPEVATTVAAKLVGDKVVAVVGHICSGATRAALGVYLDAKIIAVSPSSTNPALTKSGEYPNFFRTIAPDDAQADLVVNFVVNNLKLRRIAVLHDRGDYGRGFAEYAQRYLVAAGAEVVIFEGIQVGAVDYSAIINKVAASGAEAVIYGGYHPEASRLVNQMRARGMKAAFLGADGLKDETFINVAKEAAEGVYASGPRDVSMNPLAIKAADAHRAKHGEDPGPFFMNGYAATQVILYAIQKAGSTDYEAILTALRAGAFDTPLGKISFDAKGDGVGVGFSMYQVQNGVFVELN
ncbi:MAG TPA: branched-chain amino acid ABC transporter substrate-binding protein, partial [Magnetospirillaceae bacterium]|nr:branched-chain amino acid ABC transporter substrate-binding protein [Magnetospirillaceae bacterium]